MPRRPASNASTAGESDDDDNFEFTGTPLAELPPLEIDRYKKTRVRVSLEKVFETQYSVRSYQADFAHRTTEDIERNGYHTNVGCITVTLQDTAHSADVVANEFFSHDTNLIDGRHRRRLLLRFKRNNHPRHGAIALSCEVEIWERWDNQLITPDELIAIGAYLNHRTQDGTLHDGFDTEIETIVNLIHASADTYDFPVEEVSNTVVLDLMTKRLVKYNNSRSQREKYSYFATILARSPQCYAQFTEAMKNLPSIGITHFSDVSITRVDNTTFPIILDGLKRWSSKEGRGSFSSIRKVFYERFWKMWEQVTHFKNRNNLDIEEVLMEEIVMAKNQKPTTIETFLAVELGKVENTKNRASRQTGTNRCISVIAQMLAKHPSDPLYKAKLIRQREEAEARAAAAAQRQKELEEQRLERERTLRSAEQSAQGNPSSSKSTKAATPRNTTEAATDNARRNRKGTKQANRKGTKSTSSGQPGRYPQRNRRPRQDRLETESRPLKRNRRAGTSAAAGSTSNPASTTGNNDESTPGVVPKDPSAEFVTEVLKNTEIEVMEQSLADAGIDAVILKTDDINGNEGRGWENAKDRDKFIDTIPETPPHGFTVPELDKDAIPPPRPGQPWTLLREVVNNKGPTNIDKNSVLKACHIPVQHRAYSMLSNNEVELEVAQAIARGCLNKANASHSLVYSRSIHPPQSIANIRTQLMEEVKALPDASMFYHERCEELHTKGFTIVEDLWDDIDLKQIVPDLETSTTNPMQSFHAHMELTVPRRKQRRDGTHPGWMKILNYQEYTDEVAVVRRGAGRFMSTNKGVMDELEQPDTVEIQKERCKIDTRIGAVMSLMGVTKDVLPTNQSKEMYCPKTGGRMLVTGRHSRRQKIHCDFPALSRRETLTRTGNPGFFAMATVEKTVVWVVESSHRSLAMTEYKTARAMSHAMKAVPVLIPANSLFICRGDCFHAGAAYKDCDPPSETPRYHIYFIPVGVDLPDGVYLNHDFDPKFAKNEGGSSDEDQENDDDDNLSPNEIDDMSDKFSSEEESLEDGDRDYSLE